MDHFFKFRDQISFNLEIHEFIWCTLKFRDQFDFYKEV
jgi:hypothetical protein